MISKKIYSLQIKTKQDFSENLQAILQVVKSSEEGSVILTPELALSGFCYQKMDKADEFSKVATQELLEASIEGRTIITTMIEKKNHKFYNNLKVFHNGELIHKQAKHELFLLGEEHLHFASGGLNEMIPFKIGDMTCGALICFELRFIDLWKRLSGVEVIFVPAQWGKARKEHFETLCKALAIANQCFVIASGGANLQMAKSSAIITPYGKVYADDEAEVISHTIELDEVEKMRKYINIRLTQ